MNGYSINDQIACIVERNKSTPVKQYHNYKNSFLKPTDNQLLNEINNNLLNPKQPTPPSGDDTQPVYSQPDRTEYIRKTQEAGTRVREAEDRVIEKEKQYAEAVKKSEEATKVVGAFKKRARSSKDFREHINDLWINHFKDNEQSVLSGKPINAKKKKASLTRGVNNFDYESNGFPPLRVDMEKEVDPEDKRKKSEKVVNQRANEKIAEANQRKGNLVNKLVNKIIQDGYNKNHNHKQIDPKNVKQEAREFINKLEDIHERQQDEVKKQYKITQARLKQVVTGLKKEKEKKVVKGSYDMKNRMKELKKLKEGKMVGELKKKNLREDL